MDKQVTSQLDVLPMPEPGIYEQMYHYLYDYHFGHITFLELLDKWRQILHLPTHEQQENS
jgi:hypothetical protein